jgi:hypothetical protein
MRAWGMRRVAVRAVTWQVVVRGVDDLGMERDQC